MKVLVVTVLVVAAAAVMAADPHLKLAGSQALSQHPANRGFNSHSNPVAEVDVTSEDWSPETCGCPSSRGGKYRTRNGTHGLALESVYHHPMT